MKLEKLEKHKIDIKEIKEESYFYNEIGDKLNELIEVHNNQEKINQKIIEIEENNQSLINLLEKKIDFIMKNSSNTKKVWLAGSFKSCETLKDLYKE